MQQCLCCSSHLRGPTLHESAVHLPKIPSGCRLDVQQRTDPSPPLPLCAQAGHRQQPCQPWQQLAWCGMPRTCSATTTRASRCWTPSPASSTSTTCLARASEHPPPMAHRRRSCWHRRHTQRVAGAQSSSSSLPPPHLPTAPRLDLRRAPASYPGFAVGDVRTHAAALHGLPFLPLHTAACAA